MDGIDRSIVSQLERDARLSMVELGERVGLSSSPTHRRVKALETAGVIRGYRAEVDPVAVGRGFEVYVSVLLAQVDPATVAAFEAAVATIDEVRSCHRLFGEPDYLLLVDTADLAGYERLWSSRLSVLPGTARVASQMTMKVVKR